jgi:hypothetical protein
MKNSKITHITRINKQYQLYGLYCPYSDEIKNYIKEGLNLVQIGNKYGCSNKIIHKFIKKYER